MTTLGETLQAEASRILDGALAGRSKRIAFVYLCDRNTGTEAFACASAGIPSGSEAKDRREMIDTIRAVLVGLEGN